jgi:hypothetical protein
MLDYRLIDYKATVTKDNETYIDLLSKVWQNKTPNTGKVIVVNEYYVARPDLISLALYGSDEYADILCKLNGISNPFELNENDLLFCPTIEYLREACKFCEGPSEMVKTDKDEISAPVETFQKRYDSKRSPNEQLVGDSNYVIDKSLGLIFY